MTLEDLETLKEDLQEAIAGTLWMDEFGGNEDKIAALAAKKVLELLDDNGYINLEE